MATYQTNAFRGGLKILIDSEPFSIISNECVKPGKGQAFNRVKMRHLLSGRVLEKTFKSGESVEAADVLDVDMQYLYSDGNAYHFMDTNTYEQMAIQGDVIGNNVRWLKEQDMCTVTLWNGSPIDIVVPNFVELLVTHADPGLKGDTVSGATKPATLETGAEIRVPLFIEPGDVIRIDTRTGEYVGRS